MFRRVIVTVWILLSFSTLNADDLDTQDIGDLSVEIVAVNRDSARVIDLKGSDSHFHVILTNRGKQELRLWQAWNSWGYFNLSFDVVGANGEVNKRLTKLANKSWTRNGPSWVVLQPGESHVINVFWSRADWDLPFLTTADTKNAFDLRLRAVYSVTPDEASKKHQVWTGTIRSSAKTYRVNYWKGNVQDEPAEAVAAPGDSDAGGKHAAPALNQPGDDPNEEQRVAEPFIKLGEVPVGQFTGTVLFQYPEDDGKRFRVDVAISKPNDAEGIDAKRIDVMLITREGDSVGVTDRPRAGNLIEVNSAGTTASAIYFFARETRRDQLAATVITVDGRTTVLKIPRRNMGSAQH